jgi:hypothetical protein
MNELKSVGYHFVDLPMFVMTGGGAMCIFGVGDEC